MRLSALTLGLLTLLTCGPMVLPGAAEESLPLGNTNTVLTSHQPKTGTGFAYDLTVNGTVTISQPTTTPKVDVQKQDIRLEAGLEVRWEKKAADGTWSAKLNLVAPRTLAGGKEIASSQDATTPFAGKFDTYSQVTAITTPSILQNLGLDFTHALLGLTVPMPAGSAGVGTSWVTRSVIGQGKGFDLRTTYTLVGFEERRNTTLAYVRGSLVLSPRDVVSRTNYVGYLEAFVDPSTGRVLESALSLDITTKATLPTPKTGVADETTIRTVITALLLDLGPAAASAPPTPTPVKPVQPKPEPVPVSTVGQASVEPATRPQTSEAALPARPQVSNTSEATAPQSTDAVAATQPSANVLPIVTNNNSKSGNSTATPVNSSAEITPPARWQKGLGYTDPAGRFLVNLPAGWQSAAQRITADTTAFAGPIAPQMLYVFSSQADNQSLLDFAQAVLTEYAKASREFRLLNDLSPTDVNGQAALVAYYNYPEAGSGRSVNELSLFTRYQGQNYIVQYTDEPQRLTQEQATALEYLRRAFNFGPTPDGSVPAGTLMEGSFIRYTDANHRYSLDMPTLWPLQSQSDAKNVVTFAELGKKGYLTVYAQPGLDKYQVENVILAWRAQWAKQENEYQETSGFDTALFGGLQGVSLSYSWQNTDARKWQRRLKAVVYQGTLYAVVIDYVAEGAAERATAFDRIFASFELTGVPVSAESSLDQPAVAAKTESTTNTNTATQTSTGATQAAVSTSQRNTGVVSGGGQVSLTSQVRLEDPIGDTRALLAGRLGMQQGTEIRWLSGVTLRLRVGPSLYATRTDSRGYFAFANIAPLSNGHYVLVDAEGLLPGYREPVTVTFNGVQIPAQPGRFIDVGYVTLQVHSNGTLDVTNTSTNALPDPLEIPRYLVSAYPQSAWLPLIRAAMSRR